MKPNAAGFYNVSWAKVTYSSADNGEQVMVVYVVLCSYFEVYKKFCNNSHSNDFVVMHLCVLLCIEHLASWRACTSSI